MATKQGTAKNDTLTGTKGKDRLAGLDGNDLLRGLGGSDELFGGNGIDRLEGGDGSDYLEGGAGDDDLRGGKGNDLYIVDHAKDITLTLADPGIDRVVSLITYTLGAQQEELILFGKSKINGTGNAGDNFLVGNDGVNILSGMNGRDELNGGKGRDVLRGGGGDDTYVIDHALEIELGRADPGRDRVLSTVSYTLGVHQENLELLGTANLSGTGNAGDNSIVGNSGANVLRGNGGNDLLFGGGGIDSLHGGAGDDEYTLDNPTEIDKSEADAGHDSVAVNFDYTLGDNQEDLYIYRVTNQTQTIRITGNGAANFLGGSPLSGDELYGGDGGDTLNGGAGDDDLRGEGGNDTYFIDHDGDIDRAVLDAGNDRVNSAINYTLGANQEELFLFGNAVNGTGNSGDNWLVGNAAQNLLIGGDGNDVLDGGTGDDDLRGEGGNDGYVVDHDGDIDRGLNDAGNDKVFASINYALGDNQENLALTGTADLNGTGNRFANEMTGNSGVNVLLGGDGNDILDGLGGDDDLRGDGGNDTYFVDHDGDIDRSVLDAGTDRVNSSISYVLGAHQEVLVLGGTANLSGTGNATANLIIGNSGQNLLLGGEGDDELDGLGGDDDLRGEGGNDTYFVDHDGDIDKTVLDAGRDRVNSIISYTLGAQQEELVLGGTSNLNGTGNGGNNLVVGNSGANELRGGGGNDELRGAGGADSLFGEGGSDVLYYHAAATLLDGGADVDGLFVTGTTATTLLDLTAAGGPQITDIEDILFDAAGGNDAAQRAQTYTLRVAAADVLDLSSTSDLVRVFGEAGDTLQLVGTWVEDADLALFLESQSPDLQFQAWTNGLAQIATLDVVTVVQV